MILQIYILFFSLVLWKTSAQEPVISQWSTRNHDLLRQSSSTNGGPSDTGNLKTTARWFIFYDNMEMSPIYIVGETSLFFLVNYESTDSSGLQLHAINLDGRGNAIPSWNTEKLPDEQKMVVAFPPSVHPVTQIAACSLTYSTSNVTFGPLLNCYTQDQGENTFPTREFRELIPSVPTLPLLLSMEFIAPELLLLTNRGTNVSIASDYLLFNVTSGNLLWNTKGLFDVLDDQSEAKPFTPTIVNNNYYYITNSSDVSDHSIVAFRYNDGGTSSLLWTYTFSNPNYPTQDYDLGIPLYRNAELNIPSANDILFVTLSPVNPASTNPAYLIALNPSTGNLQWSKEFSEPILGVAACFDSRIGLYLLVSTTHTLSSWRVNVTPPSINEAWNVTGLTGPISAPVVDKIGSVYICDKGKLRGYNLVGNPIINVDHGQTTGNLCDQPIILDNSIIVRANLGQPSNGILFAGLGPYNPTPPLSPADENEIGMIVGICIGVLFLLLIILVIIKFRRRRRGRHYNVLN